MFYWVIRVYTSGDLPPCSFLLPPSPYDHSRHRWRAHGLFRFFSCSHFGRVDILQRTAEGVVACSDQEADLPPCQVPALLRRSRGETALSSMRSRKRTTTILTA